jgi:hypothetical protein
MRLFCLLFALLPFYSLAQVDTTIGKNVPVQKDYKLLTLAVCEGLSSDKEKANAIYNWVTSHISLDLKETKNPNRPPATVENILRKSMATPDGYALLFTEMCREAGINAVTILGYAKNIYFDTGDKFYIPRHNWAAVLIDGNWELVDPTLGAGYVESYSSWMHNQLSKLKKEELKLDDKERFKPAYNPAYFMVDPLQLRFTHLPADPIWQLTQSHMPLQVFEGGDSLILDFNRSHGNVQKDNAALLPVSLLNDDDKVLDYASRAFAFNGRFEGILGLKQAIEANRSLTDLVQHREENINKADILTAKQKLRNAAEYFKAQKRSVAGNYRELNIKNLQKNRQAKEYFVRARLNDKKYLSMYNRYAVAAERDATRVGADTIAAKTRKEGLSGNKLKSIETSSPQKDANSPELMRLSDSINARFARMENLNSFIDVEEQVISEASEQANNTFLLVLNKLGFADSLFISESFFRFRFRDSYDDEVRKRSDLYKQVKLVEADSLQQKYFALCDTIDKHFATWQKASIQFMDLYKNNIKDIEQYRKWNSGETAITDEYTRTVLHYIRFIDSYLDQLDIQATYKRDCTRYYKTIAASYEANLKRIDEMEEVEAKRMEIEKKEIEENRSFDDIDLQNKLNAVQSSLQQIEKIL